MIAADGVGEAAQEQDEKADAAPGVAACCADHSGQYNAGRSRPEENGWLISQGLGLKEAE